MLGSARLPPLSRSSRSTAFHAAGRVGTIATGHRADLVLLDANPLASVGNVSRIAGVMVRGRWLPKTEIDARLERIAAVYATPGN
jgi:cytosine/adenosine deaminase-related metal-dependent hydrolase